MSDTNKVLEIIDGMKQEIVDGVSRVVQVPSVNPKYPGVDYDEEVGGESDANKVIADFYEKTGCDMDVWAEEPGRNNVVGTIKGSGGGRSLIFNGHIDTVPTGRHEDWKFSNPFSGRVENNNIYGRGACDMKGGVVAQAMAATALHRAGVKLKGDLILESVVGEEVMDHEAGTTATIKRGYRADAAIVSEPSASGETPLAVVPVSPGAAVDVGHVQREGQPRVQPRRDYPRRRARHKRGGQRRRQGHPDIRGAAQARAGVGAD